MKIAVNKCYGGFGLSKEAQLLYAKKSGFELFFYTQTKYNHRDGVVEYSRDTGDSLFNNAYKEDLGDTFEKAPNGSYWYYGDIERTDPILIDVIEELGEEKASGDLAELKIVEIPDGIEYEIDDYDGIESIHESHRSW